jgi:opacity protein-like surface antigen
VIGVTVPDASGVPVLSTNVGTGALNRTTPRKSQQYRLRVNYNPRPWAVISATGNYLNQSNNAATVDYTYRNRNYGIAATLTPRRNYAFELAYNYNLLRQSGFICFIDAAPNTPTFLSGGAVTSLTCPFDVTFNAAGVPTGTAGFFQTVGNYHSTNNFFSALWRGKVLPRVTVTLGYSISNNSGNELLTNPQLVQAGVPVLGTLQSSFHRPLAGMEVDLVKNVTAKLGWNYYDYNEKGGAGPTNPRDFHSNSGTVSLKYAF